jgi:hypothetical protein
MTFFSKGDKQKVAELRVMFCECNRETLISCWIDAEKVRESPANGVREIH